MSIYLVTWNVVGRAPTEELKSLLNLDDNRHVVDIYAIGLQEVNAKPHAFLLDMVCEDYWTKAFRDLLGPLNFVQIKSIRLQGLLLVVFVKRQHLLHIRGLQTNYTRTGLGGFWGNKGAVTIRMNAYKCSVCIINCHLAAHDGEVEQRIKDYNAIIDAQLFNDAGSNSGSNVILCHDYVFWIGDLNFRADLGLSGEAISKFIKNSDFKSILKDDQLSVARTKGVAFAEFSEDSINFPPTYKYFLGTDNYDLKRRPGYTDRIVYKVIPDAYENTTLSIRKKAYKAHQKYRQSDHKPVTGHYDIKVFPQLETEVHFEPVHKWFSGDENSCAYTMHKGTRTSTWDWVGLFKFDFTTMDDFSSYVWASSSAEQQSSSFRVTFPIAEINPGTYVLLYITDAGDVLGKSEPFEIVSRV